MPMSTTYPSGDFWPQYVNCNCACNICMSGRCCMSPVPSWHWQPTTTVSWTVPPVVPERVEIRRNPDGTIDEVLLYVGDRCVFHLEQNSPLSWYFNLYPRAGDPEQFSINARKRVTVRDRRDAE